MPNEITAPVLDMAELQECANQAAMKAARQEIDNFYNGYGSPFRKAVHEYLEKNTPSVNFDLPNLVEEIQKSLISEIEKFESTTAIKNCVAAIRKSITRLNLENDGTIKLSSVLEEMEREIDTKNGEYIEAEVGEPDPSYGWRDLEITIHKEDEEKNFKVTLHNDNKYENGEIINTDRYIVLSMPYSRYNSEKARVKIHDTPDVEIELPIFHGLADNHVLMTIARLVMYKTPIIIDCEDYRTNDNY